MATEAADLRVKVSATGTAGTVAELAAVDKAIDTVGDDSRDTTTETDLLGRSLLGLGDQAGDTAGDVAGLGGSASGLAGAMGQAGGASDAFAIILKGTLFAALGAVLAPLVSIVSTLGALVAGLAAALPGILAVGGAIAFVGREALLTATHTDNLADAFKKLTKEGTVIGEALDDLKAAAKPMADEFMHFVQDVAPAVIGAFTDVVEMLEVFFEPIMRRIGTETKEWANIMLNSAAHVLPMVADGIKRISGVFQRLYKAFEPAIQPAIDGLLTIVEGLGRGITKWLEPMIPFIKPVSKALGDFLVILGRELGKVSKALAPSMPVFFKLLGDVIKFLGDVLVEVAPLIKPFLKELREFFKDKDNMQAVADIIKLLVDTFAFMTTIAGPVLRFIADFIEMMRDIGDVFREAPGAIARFFENLPGVIMRALKGAGRWLLEMGGKVIDGFMRGVRRSWRAVANWFGDMRTTVAGWLSSAFNWLVEGGRNIIDGLVKGIQRAWRAVVNWFKRIPGNVKDFFTGAADWLLSAGSNVIEGLRQGLENAWGGLVSWFTDKLNWLKNIPGASLIIHSPSKVYREYGRNIMRGLWMGMRDEFPGVDKAMDDTLGKLHGDASMDVHGRRGGLAVAGASGRMHGTLRIVGTKDLYAVIDARVDRGVERRARFDDRIRKMHR